MSGYDIGPRIGLHGEKEFNNQIKNVNNSLREYGSEMNALTAKFAENANGQEALIAKTKVLEKQYDAQNKKHSILQSQYDKELKKLKELADAYQKASKESGSNSDEAAKAEKAYNNQAEAVSKLKVSMNETEGYASKLEKAIIDNKKALREMEEGTRDVTTGLSKLGDEAEETADDVKKLGEKIDAGTLIGAADTFKDFGESVLDAAENSKEYLKIMGQLEASSENLQYTNEETKESYQQLFGVLEDEQSTATTVANLQALKLEQSSLKTLTEGVIGAWAKYGDSIPIDGLAEAVNETVKVGEVTGTLSDVLTWAGTNEDEFNEKLKSCASETEKAQLIIQEFANQGLMDVADAFRQNNEALIKNNEANAKYQEEMAELGEKMLGIKTAITEVGTVMLETFNSLPEPVQNVVIGIGALIVAISLLSPIITAVSGVMTAFGVASAASATGTAVAGTAAGGAAVGFGALSASLLPIIGIIAAVIAAIALIVVAIKNWDNITSWFKDNTEKAAEKLKNCFDSISNKVSNTKEKAVAKMKEMKEGVAKSISDIKNFFSNLKLSFPKIQIPKISIPKFTISGKFSLGPPPTVPKFSVKWNKDGAILSGAQLFGRLGNRLLGGGEAGPEALLPLRTFYKKWQEINSNSFSDFMKDYSNVMKLEFKPVFHVNVGNRELKSYVIKTAKEGMNSEMRDVMKASGSL